MSLEAGVRLGAYEILGAIGAGGMGEVFRARDLRLNRGVAIKILPPLFADDPERLARFEREAQILASLNHPNIAQIYGIEESEGRKALVMELVDGDDLAAHIAGAGALPLPDCVAIARQIADALACAHEQGIVHRDLKPANVKVREDGTVKVLDFGLAKLADPLSGSSPSSPVLSPTITSPATQLGVILGTAAYMAPEQARGKVVDKRADVWAFGLILYEMLTGRRAFEGSEISDTLAFVLTKDPDWSAIPAGTPPALMRLLRRCVQKERTQRLADMSDARLELEEALAPGQVEGSAIAAPVKRSRWFIPAIGVAMLAAAALGAALAWSVLNRPAPPLPTVRFTLPLAADVAFTNAGRHLVAISPDGSRIVFVANRQLYLRRIGSTAAQPITGSGTAGAVIGPAFSPDGEHLVYWSQQALRKIAVAGGAPVTLAPVTRNPYSIHWTTAGIFVGGGPDGVLRVPAEGGKPESIVAPTDGEFVQRPQLLPGGEWLLLTVGAGARASDRWDTSRVVAHSLKTGERKVLIEGGGDARYVASGHILYAAGGVVFAVPFDLESMTVRGSARAVIEGVRRSGVTGASQFAVADNGTLAYVPGPPDPVSEERRVAFVERQGTNVPIDLPPRAYETPRVSPDGTRIAVVDASNDAADIWIYELSGASAIRRLTFGGRNRAPVWSPDGSQIVFQSDREGDLALYVQPADGSGAALRLTRPAKDTRHTPTGWSPDGQLLAFSEAYAPRPPAVHILSMKDKTARPLHSAEDGLWSGGGVFSPDGRWLAYHGGPLVDATVDRPHVFVEPFPTTRARYQIAPGLDAVWSRDGTELFLNPTQPGFASFRIITEPRFTFSALGRIVSDAAPTSLGIGRRYDVMPDGKRLLIVMRGTGAETEAREIEVVLNWFRELGASK